MTRALLNYWIVLVGRVLTRPVGLKPDPSTSKLSRSVVPGWWWLGLLLPLVSSCAVLSPAVQNCKVLDPDLAVGEYHGACQNGLAEGYAEVTGTSTYRGDFVAGKKHGKGIKVMANGDRYVGEFLDDYRHGKGTYIWGDSTPWAGDRYEGEYDHDKRQGWGIFQWGSGDRYEGLWQNDLRMGWSVMESRRKQVAIQQPKDLTQGMVLCAELPLGLNASQQLRAKVERVDEAKLYLEVVAMDGTRASYQGRVIKLGEHIDGTAEQWHICGLN